MIGAMPEEDFEEPMKLMIFLASSIPMSSVPKAMMVVMNNSIQTSATRL
jgi:hypothetical protein